MYWTLEFFFTNELSLGLLFSLYVWLVFFVRVYHARFYENITCCYQPESTIILPVYNEDPNIFRQCVSRLKQYFDGEVIVVVNGVWDGMEKVVDLAKEAGARVVTLSDADKRNAIVTGCQHAKTDIVVLLDSDTIITSQSIVEILRPFQDPTVGGVTSYQRIYLPNSSIIARIADWLEHLRYLINQRAQSWFNSVGCLPGRMIAIRKNIIMENSHSFINQKVFGILCKSGDDRYLTSCCLRSGYKTLLQSSSKVYTYPPNSWRKFFLQQLRWARSSQRETLLSLRWLPRFQFTFFCFAIDIITPVFFVCVVLLYATYWNYSGNTIAFILLTFTFATLSLGLRQLPHIFRQPSDLYLLPLFVVVATALAFLRVYGLLSCLDTRWKTRSQK